MNVSALAMKFGFLFTAVCGLSSVADGSQLRDDVIVLMYETDDSLQHDEKSPLHFFQQRGKIANLQTTVFGGKLAYHGFGDKYQTLKPLLEVADPNKLIILADARDVILNVPDNKALASLAIDNFVETYKKLTADAPNAVILSAEAQCCVSAMAHAHPSDYFDPITKERKSRACSSGKEDCLWHPSKNIDDWQVFMEELAYNTTGDDLSDVYLNAGLMAGYPTDLINLLNFLNINPSEDDQAVLSGLMYQFPDMIKLDYKQEMFGNNQWPRGLVDGCVFEPQGEHLSLIHTETGTEPLILHTPGKFYDCLDVLIEDLGGISQQRYLFGLEHIDEVAVNNGFTVTSERKDPTRSRALQSNGQDDLPERRRRLLFFGRIHAMLESIKAKLSLQNSTPAPTAAEPTPDDRIEPTPDDRIEPTPDDRIEPTPDDTIPDVEEDSNYGVSNYGVASNYGVSNYGVASNYGVPYNYVETKPNYGVSNYGTSNYGISKYRATNYGVVESEAQEENYGNYGLRHRHRHRAL